MCGFLNTDFVTYYAQQMNVIRFSQGKQPQIKIGDLGTINIPNNNNLQNDISALCKELYKNLDLKEIIKIQINEMYIQRNIIPFLLPLTYFSLLSQKYEKNKSIQKASNTASTW